MHAYPIFLDINTAGILTLKSYPIQTISSNPISTDTFIEAIIYIDTMALITFYKTQILI